MQILSCLATFLLVLFLVGVCVAKKGNLIGDVLAHYETLHTNDIFHGVRKRDVESKERVISFTTLGRHFTLQLTPHAEIFSEKFHAYSIGGSGEKREVVVDKDSFYRGYAEGDSSSRVSLHLDHGVITASIAMKDDTYVIEPSWRHIGESSEHQMISYRHSDVKSSITNQDPKKKKFGFCGHDSHHSTVLYNKETKHPVPQEQSSRRRRAMATKIRCPMALVADYRFYTEMGLNSKDKTINYMIGVIDRVDLIFQNTSWSDEYRGYGFEIELVEVHENASPENRLHYNMKRDTAWPIKTLLTTFSREPKWGKYCLAHLFTYQDFTDGVIGLAYVGNPKLNAVGGICTDDYLSNNSIFYLNTGLSSSVNWDRRVLTEEADIVTAHEIGHNFGSEHDPETAECAPSDGQGGKFIMYPASVSGQRSNNKLFSACSKRRILEVLIAKSQICFREPRDKICGNYKKEQGEECDPGGIVPEDSQCCTKECKLKEGFNCSDGYDSPCCRNCQYSNTTVCRDADKSTCKGSTTCDGSGIECPKAPNIPDGTVCIDRGECKNGECVPFCEVKGLKPCKCTTSIDACKVCCSEPTSDVCTPYKHNQTGETLNIFDGRPCQSVEQGMCIKGKCEKSSQDLVERFWTFITTLDIDKVARFMQDNLAGTVVVLSLLIWLPASGYINWLDRKRDKQEAKEAEWRDPKNTQLLRQPKATSKGTFIYRQDSVSRSSKPNKPVKIKPKYIKTQATPKLEYTVQRESNL